MYTWSQDVIDSNWTHFVVSNYIIYNFKLCLPTHALAVYCSVDSQGQLVDVFMYTVIIVRSGLHYEASFGASSL